MHLEFHLVVVLISYRFIMNCLFTITYCMGFVHDLFFMVVNRSLQYPNCKLNYSV